MEGAEGCGSEAIGVKATAGCWLCKGMTESEKRRMAVAGVAGRWRCVVREVLATTSMVCWRMLDRVRFDCGRFEGATVSRLQHAA